MSERTHLFISYARDDDEPFVRKLYEDLITRNWKIWWDRQSMPNRGLTFTQEIRDAIDGSDRLLLVVGPAAVVSDYVRSEWQHALLFAKGVIPILRLGDYSLLPVELRELHCPDFRATRRYDDALHELLRLLCEPLVELSPLLSSVPALPPHFLINTESLKCLGGLVLADIHKPMVIPPPQQTIALHGMGGIGKSVLATAFARAADIRRAFLDGILWLAANRDADLLTNIRIVADAYEEDLSAYRELTTANARLPRLLEKKVCLIILDDVWEIEHAAIFQAALGPRCRLLITTRDASMASALGAQVYSVDLLTKEMASTLLAHWSGQSVPLLPTEALEVAQECGYLPLALALSGAVAGDGVPWRDIRNALRTADLEFLDHPYGSIMKSLRVGIDRLPSEEARRYNELAVFPPGEPVPESAIRTLWSHRANMNERNTRKLVIKLKNKALLTLEGDPGNFRVALHELQRDYLCASLPDPEPLHADLLKAYEKRCGGYWPQGPNDGYYFQRLGYHLTKAGRHHEWLELLTNIEWINAECSALDVYRLLDDLTVASSEASAHAPTGKALEILRRAINAKSHLLKDDPGLLVPQLYNLLSSSWDATSILGNTLRRAAEEYSRCWLRVAESIHPEAPAYTTLSDHAGLVSSLSFSPDGSLLASCSFDNKIRLWESKSGRLMGTLDGHVLVNSVTFHPSGTLLATSGWTGEVILWDLDERTVDRIAHFMDEQGNSKPLYAVKFSPDGQLLAGASSDHTVKIWEVRTRELIRDQPGHTARVNGITFLEDGQVVASASDDKTIRLWNSFTGEAIATLVGHTGAINEIALSADGATMASASDDRTVRLWDIASKRCTAVLSGQRTAVKSVAFASDGLTLASGGDDGIVKLWNTVSQRATATLPMHAGPVRCLAFSPDAHRIASCGGALVKVWSPNEVRAAGVRKGHQGRIFAASFSPSAEFVATAGVDKKAILWRANASARRVQSLRLGGLGRAIAFGNSGCLVIIGLEVSRKLKGKDIRRDSGRVLLWDTESGQKRVFKITGGGGVHAVAFSQTSQCIAAGTWSGKVAIWDSRSGEELWVFECNTPETSCSVEALAFSPDGKVLAIGGQIAQPVEVDGHFGYTNATGQVMLWDIDSRQMRMSFEPGEFNVTSIAFHSGGDIIAIGSTDRTARLWGKEFGPITVWNISTHLSEQVLIGHQGGVRCLAFSQDGTLLASGGDEDHVVKLWHVTTGELVTWMVCEDDVLAVWFDPVLSQLRVADAGGAEKAPNVHILDIMNAPRGR